MATSEIENIVNSTTLSDSDKITQLYNKIKVLINYLTIMNTAISDETDSLNALMDANGNNSEEHHAKTMVFYGRKLSVRDVMLGVAATDPSHLQPPEVSIFTGLQAIISQNDFGRLPIRWDCWNDKDGSIETLYKSGQKPATQFLDQTHMLGSRVTMPTIRNLDNDGKGTGTNTYKLKSGYIINGWRIDQAYVPVYMYEDTGNNYRKQTVNGSPQNVPDNRVFAFAANDFKLPFKPSILPAVTTQKPYVKFVLDIIPVWFTIEFVVRHGTVADAAPCKVPLKTIIRQTVTLPLATLITMDAGYEIDKTTNPYGTWTTVDPNTGTSQVDPDGDTIADAEYAAGDQFLVGTDIDAGVRRLYLKIKTA